MVRVRKRKAPNQATGQRKRMRRARVGKSAANLRNDLHFFRRNFATGDLVGNATYTPWLQGLSFSLGQMPNVSDFTTLFDRYMITHIRARYYLKIDPSAQTAAAASYPRFYYVKDYDDDTNPTSLDQLREHSKCRTVVMNPNRPVEINFKPAVLSEVYRGIATTSYSPKWKQWIDMAHTDVKHYGIKYGIDDLSNTNYKVTTEFTVWFRCKDVR